MPSSTQNNTGPRYTVIYSKRRKLAITVERDRAIVVHAPEGTDPAKIHAIVESRKLWLYEKTRHPQKYDPPSPPGKELVNGESVLYLGRQYRIQLVDGEGGIEFDSKFLVPRKLLDERRDAFRAWYIAKAEEIILPRVAEHAKSLGVSYNQAKIINSKYRWGSCTPRNNIHINWRLIKAPMFVINYVVIHELAHLREPNHTPRLWNIIRAQIVDVDKAKAWLRDNGSLLELDI